MRFFWGVCLCVLSLCVEGGASGGFVSISKSLIRPSVTATTAGYFILKNSSKESVDLIKVEFDPSSVAISEKIELHNEKMEEQKSISFGPEKETPIQPGKFHIMFMKISKPLTKGEVVPLVFTFTQGSKTFKEKVTFTVSDNATIEKTYKCGCCTSDKPAKAEKKEG